MEVFVLPDCFEIVKAWRALAILARVLISSSCSDEHGPVVISIKLLLIMHINVLQDIQVTRI